MDNNCIYCGIENEDDDFFPDDKDLKVVGDELVIRNGWNEESRIVVPFCPMCAKPTPVVKRVDSQEGRYLHFTIK